MRRLYAIIPLFGCWSAIGQSSAYEDYLAQIAALQQNSVSMTQDGRDALIEQYRGLLETYPGFANNIRLETQIAMLYESDFSDIGQPPDYQAAFETYRHISESYEADHPYMPTVRRLTADCASEFDSDAATQLYTDIIQDYPESEALVVHSEYSLGKLAEKQGDIVTAQQHYQRVLEHTPSAAGLSESEQESIGVYQKNAAANLIADAIKGFDSPNDRARALKKYLEKNQELMQAHGDLVQRFTRSINNARSNANSDEDLDTAEGLLASLKKGKDGDRAGSRKDRERTREQREREQSVEQQRVARAESLGDSFATSSDGIGNATNVALSGPGSARQTAPAASWASIMVYIGVSIAAVAGIALLTLITRSRMA